MPNTTDEDENETIPVVIELPLLDEKGIEALQEFLWNLVMLFEGQYYHQLDQRKRGTLTRDPFQHWKRVAPTPVEPKEGLDEDPDDEIPF
jgi:hypothetical protein